jgi:hypothetical protein
MAPCTRVSVSNWNDYWSFAAIGMPLRDPEDDDEAEDEEDDEEDEDREPAVIREPDE